MSGDDMAEMNERIENIAEAIALEGFALVRAPEMRAQFPAARRRWLSAATVSAGS